MDATPPAAAGFGPLFANRSFLLLWASQGFSQSADRLVFILLVEAVSRLSASGTVMSATLALQMAPNVLFGALAGVLADRLDKRRVMAISNAVRGSLVLALGLFGDAHLAVPIAIGFLLTSAAQPFVPAEAAVMPLVVPRASLLQANSVSAMTMICSLVVGFALGEPLSHVAGPFGAACVVATCYLLAAACVHFVRLTYPATVAPPQESYGLQLRQGLAYIGRRGGVRRTIALQVAIFSTFASLSVVAIIFAKAVLVTSFSWLLAAGGVGMALGGWLIGRFGGGWNRDLTIATGFLATAAGLVLLAGFGMESKPIAYAMVAGLGFTSSVVGVPLQTRLQELVEDGVRGKVFGVQNTVLNVVAIVPLAGVGVVVKRIGVPLVLLGMAVVMVGAGVAAWLGRLGERPDRAAGGGRANGPAEGPTDEPAEGPAAAQGP